MQQTLVDEEGHTTRPTVCIQVAQSPQFPDGIRQLAAEFLVCLCEAREKAPGMMRKLPQYISQLFSCMLLFLLDVTVRPRLSPQIARVQVAMSIALQVTTAALTLRAACSILQKAAAPTLRTLQQSPKMCLHVLLRETALLCDHMVYTQTCLML